MHIFKHAKDTAQSNELMLYLKSILFSGTDKKSDIILSKNQNIMTKKMKWYENATISVLTAGFTGIGAGISAAIRGGSIVESTSVVTIGTGLLTAGVGFFATNKDDKRPPFSVPPKKAIVEFAMLEFAGTTLGYCATKLFINSAASTAPFIDAAIGFPFSLGLAICFGVLCNSCRNETLNNSLKPHFR